MISKLLKIKKGITSIIGGGGKTTLINVLAQELSEYGTVAITTTTHIMQSDIFCNIITENDEQNISRIKQALNDNKCVLIGSVYSGNKLSPPHISIDELSEIFDYVLVEADGSKGLPLKAHLDNEPVIPKNTTQTILVVGIDAVGYKLSDVTHRAYKACELVGVEADAIVTTEVVASLINTENLHDIVVINKCDSDSQKAVANELSQKINIKCVVSSLQKGEWYVSSN